MSAADQYLAALREAAGINQTNLNGKKQTRQKPVKLRGGCLLYQLPRARDPFRTNGLRIEPIRSIDVLCAPLRQQCDRQRKAFPAAWPRCMEGDGMQVASLSASASC